MRIHAIACAAIYLWAGAGCSGELAQRPSANDPTSAAAPEAPFHPPPSYQPDPLLNPVPPRSSEPPPTGVEPAHSPTSTPPGNPPMREEPGGHAPANPQDHGAMPGMQPDEHGAAEPPAPTVYTCSMHPEVRAKKSGKCPRCGMTLVPKTGGQ